MLSRRFLCIHGHFYQPPRENPWLHAVEAQESARPHRDWNTRIAAECYGRNAAARISTWEGRILDIRNNFRRISFNFGPTLLGWMEECRPDIYGEILDADAASVGERSGHGNAIAQAYNHTILPLATEREKQVQVVWGLEDFRHRFRRDAEGMWLPECAVDIATLECLAANGVVYTVLAPRQARRVREMAAPLREWISAEGSRIDPTRPYVCPLPSGRSIVLFFYDGPISQAIAFEGLLNDGNAFAARLMQGFDDERPWSQLLNIATDGESYGHHHRHGEMALAYALHLIEREGWARLTNYGEYLENHAPHAEAQVWNNSSWSCVHGVERWRADCGCNSGTKPGWHQRWRKPLREAFRALSARADETYGALAPQCLRDPEGALLRYIHVLLDPNPEAFRRFLAEEALRGASPEEGVDILRLMETMRMAQLVWTSCAWFFDEVTGLEGVQNLKYAGRLMQLLQPQHPQIENEYLELLKNCPSNLPEIRNAAVAHRLWVRPAIVDMQRVVAHHAITSFDRVGEEPRLVYRYEIRERDAVTTSFGNSRLKLSRVTARSLVDGESLEATAAVLHFGGHDFRCSIAAPLGFSAYEKLRDDLFTAYHKRSLTDLVRALDEHFGRSYYSINHLFAEGRRDLLRRITDDSFRRFDDTINRIYEENRKFMDYLLEMGAPLPKSFLAAAEFVLQGRLVSQLDDFLRTADASPMMETAREAARYDARMNEEMVARPLGLALGRVFRELAVAPTESLCTVAISLLEVLELLKAKPDLWEAQNIVFALVHGRALPAFLRGAASSPAPRPGQIPALAALAARLHVSTESLGVVEAGIDDRGRGSSDRIATRALAGEESGG